MVKSMFSGVAGLRAHQTKMDVIGNNIANVNTNGFKAGRVTFKDSFYQTMSGSSTASGTLGGTNAKQVGYGSQVGSIDVIHTTGGFAPTGVASDLMIEGNGFFMVGDYNKAGYDPTDPTTAQKMNLTRMGIFRFEGSGKLADPMGNVVYGFKGISAGGDVTTSMQVNKTYQTAGGAEIRITNVGDPTTTPPTLPTAEFFNKETGAWEATTATTKPKTDDLFMSKEIDDPANAGAKITIIALKTGLIDTDTLVPIELPIDPKTGAPIKLESVTFGTNGTISGIDEYGNPLTIGQVAVANVPNPEALEMINSSYYKAKNNTGAVIANTPGEGGTGTLASGGLEMSNVDLSNEFASMITTQRGFQANTRIITVTDEMLQELVNIKR